MADAIQTPTLAPRHVISVLAHQADPETLALLDPRISTAEDGWSLIWRGSRGYQTSSKELADLLGLPANSLRTVPEEHRISAQTRHPGNEMIRYLVWRDYSNEPNAPPVPGEHLVVAPRLAVEDLRGILDKLNQHATCCRASVLSHARGGEITLFHIRGDERRGSTLKEFLVAYGGRKIPILNAYQTISGTAFFPVAPPAHSLAAVARLIANAPTLFAGLTEPRLGWAPEALLFAVARGSDLPGGDAENSDTFFDIRGERFFGSAKFIPEAERPSLQFAQSLTEPTVAAEHIKARLVRPDSDFAAMLTLRKTTRSLKNEQNAAQLTTLLAEKSALERRIKTVETAIAGQSAMVVANDESFAPLARLLRQIVGSAERWQGIRYAHLARTPGHIAQTDHHGSVHVFHFGPRVAQLSRLNAALKAYDGIEFYWTDPGWAATYGQTGMVEIIVPMEHRLSPLPHSWSATDMDEYLIDMVETWSEGDIVLPPGQRHVLQFVPGQGRDGTELALEVYAEEQLWPINGRTMTWFNTVLAQSGTDQEDELRTQFEDTNARAALLQARTEREDAISTEIDAAVTQAQSAVAQAWEGFAQALDKDLAERLAQMKKRATQIEEIEEQALALEAELAKAKDMLDALVGETSTFSLSTSVKVDDQNRSLKSFLSSVQRRSRQFDTSITASDAKVTEMRNTLERIRKSWFK